MVYFDDFKAFAKQYEDEVLEYRVLNGENTVHYGMITDVVPLPNGDFLIGFNEWTARVEGSEWKLFEGNTFEFYKLSEIRLSYNPDLEAVRAEEE